MHPIHVTWMVAVLVCMHQVLAHQQQQQHSQQPFQLQQQQQPLLEQQEEVPFLPPAISPEIPTPAHKDINSQWPLHGTGPSSSPTAPHPKPAPTEPRFLGTADPPANSTLRLWYRRPAAQSNVETEGFLIGNGRTQTMFGGSVNYERLILSEQSCWSGGPQEYASYWGGNVPKDQALEKQQAIERVRQELAEKRVLRPSMPFVKDVMGDEEGFGRPAAFGEIAVEEVNPFESVRDYRRELDLERAIARVSYTVGKTLHSREQFCSYPESLCILRIQSSTPRSVNIKVTLSTPHTSSAEYSNIHNRLGFKSHLDSNNLTIEAQVAIKTEGPTGISLATSPQEIVLMGFDTVTLYYTFGSGWSANAFPEFANVDPHERLTGVLDKAVMGWYGDLMTKHLNDYGALFSRFRLDFGGDQDQETRTRGARNTLTTDQLVAKNARGTLPLSDESYLETLLVQYTRYLLIASSRPGSLPVSGNGIWMSNDHKDGTIDFRFEMNIDLQMRYWMAETTDLGETVSPLIEYVEQLLHPRGQDTASLLHRARGWATQPFSNIWAHTGPLSDTSAKDEFYFPAAAAWLCQHVWDRYLYSQDEKFLKDRGYNLMKGASLFWMDTVVKDRDNGSLLSSPSQSPGHGPFTEGSALDQQLIFQLWNRTLEAAVSIVNDKDKVFVQELTEKLKNLSRGLKIGSWGQLQEWNLDLDEPNERVPHLGPLYAVYPGDQIYQQQQQQKGQGDKEDEEDEEEHSMQELLESARVSLWSRGGRGDEYEEGWSRAWRAVTWARLNDGQQATRVLDLFKRQNLRHSNLVPLSMKELAGHAGFGAALIEMLVQSPRPGDVNVLTCYEGLPERWAKQGKMAGYRTRDGHVVAVEWRDRRVRIIELYAGLRKGAVNLRIATLLPPSESASADVARVGEAEGGDDPKKVEVVTVMMKGSKKPVVPFTREQDVIQFSVAKGQTYVVKVDTVEQ
ncbi:hypothetical protein BGX23_000508 [Mortierella sp. AD031]|nr:hypothetical protein BGX23_000508 [Mortierella sp. AD031]